jgi:hypothetical protein
LQGTDLEWQEEKLKEEQGWSLSFHDWTHLLAELEECREHVARV